MIAAGIGRPMHVNVVIEQTGRGKFAPLCVEVDLALLMVKRVWVQDHWHALEFEHLSFIYSVHPTNLIINLIILNYI